MESLGAALKLIKPNCHMASIDLKNAYYSIPIDIEHRKYLRFIWQGNLYQFCVLPNGLACAPFAFTKITKPIMSHLRNSGHVSIIYIDDTLLIGDDETSCKANLRDSLKLFVACGFEVNQEKSVFTPCTKIEFLGFVLDSKLMIVYLTAQKQDYLKQRALTLLKPHPTTIRELAEFIGICVASFPGVPLAKLHYQNLERLKNIALQQNYGNFDTKVKLTNESKEKINWWYNNISKSSSPITRPSPTVVLMTDASKKGWGAVWDNTRTGGHWCETEANEHINVLELQAIYFD
jgi:hypothetical protein